MWDRQVDFLVFGGGCGGMTAALVAAVGRAASSTWRAELVKNMAIPHSLVCEGDSGDGLDAALAIGASLDRGHSSPFFWMPCGQFGGPALRQRVNGEVLDGEGRAIERLYAAGNDMSSMMRGFYPGPGITLGPALVFAYRSAMHAAGKPLRP